MVGCVALEGEGLRQVYAQSLLAEGLRITGKGRKGRAVRVHEVGPNVNQVPTALVKLKGNGATRKSGARPLRLEGFNVLAGALHAVI